MCLVSISLSPLWVAASQLPRRGVACGWGRSACPGGYGTGVSSRRDELQAARAARAAASDGDHALARENDRLRGELAALAAQLEAASASIEGAAATHQEELEQLRRELEGTKHALVTLKGSVSWRITRPLRTLRGWLRSPR